MVPPPCDTVTSGMSNCRKTPVPTLRVVPFACITQYGELVLPAGSKWKWSRDAGYKGNCRICQHGWSTLVPGKGGGHEEIPIIASGSSGNCTKSSNHRASDG